MAYDSRDLEAGGVEVSEVSAEPIAAVTVTITRAELPNAWGPALDKVWAFIRSTGKGFTHNVFLYPAGFFREGKGDVTFGVQVDEHFQETGDGGVHCASLPGGRVAWAVHRGPYDKVGEAHDAVADWSRDTGEPLDGPSWEIYGDHNDDPALLETTVVYLLHPA
jgi:effector-binding domain-containing protein